VNPHLHFTDLCHSVQFLHDAQNEEVDTPEYNNQRLHIARLRASSIEISEHLLPDHHRSIQRVTDKLRLLKPPRVYVINDPVLNAQVCTDHDENEAFILCNSGLINLLEVLEFDFVLGHELGHFGLEHKTVDHSDLNPVQLIHALRKQRSAELSCDRIGLLATQSLNVATSVMIKMASGLKGPFLPQVTKNIIHALHQTQSTQQISQIDVWDSHPAISIRIWALHLFAGSQKYLELTGSGGSERPLHVIDEEITNSIFTPLEDESHDDIERNIDLAISWIGALIIIEDQEIEAEEIEALNSVVGIDLASKIIRFCKSHPNIAVEEKAIEAITRIQSLPPSEKRNLNLALHRMINLLKIDYENGKPLRWKNILDQYIQI
jgi:hypothetical protein